jgi:hypothetical protein
MWSNGCITRPAREGLRRDSTLSCPLGESSSLDFMLLAGSATAVFGGDESALEGKEPRAFARLWNGTP